MPSHNPLEPHSWNKFTRLRGPTLCRYPAALKTAQGKTRLSDTTSVLTRKWLITKTESVRKLKNRDTAAKANQDFACSSCINAKELGRSWATEHITSLLGS
eukprot:1156462-Pelagomonas_calceolata.AAC.1